jgi:RNA polymerase sigma-70 factor (ECF subfamily)
MKIFGNKKTPDQVLNTESSKNSSTMATKQVRYEALVKALHGDLYRYAYWLTHDKQVAEDLVQETFLRAWRALDSLKDEKAAKSWLITILRRENARRFERKRFDMSEYEEASIIDKKSTTTEQVIENQWLRDNIAQVPPEYSEPLV